MSAREQLTVACARAFSVEWRRAMAHRIWIVALSDRVILPEDPMP
jgi:hypothetical protein